MNRRRFLKIAGSTGVIVAAGGVGFTATAAATDPFMPWESAGSQYTDPIRRALSYAILAPNPHNRQPWMVDLKSNTEAVLLCDLDRLLPSTDPYSRQIVIGLGCFLELFAIAAADQGYRADIRYFPDGTPGDQLDRRAIAYLALEKQAGLGSDPLFAHTLDRHTNRGVHDTSKAVDDTIIGRLRDAAAENVEVGTASDPRLQDLRALTRDAILSELLAPEAFQESAELTRIGNTEIAANPDGISMGDGLLQALSLTGAQLREGLADPSSRIFQMVLGVFEASAMSSMGFIWINTSDNDRVAQIEAGRAYLRIALQAAGDGLAMQPMSQALQEYPAMAPYYETVHDWLTDQPGERVQMLARFGYANDVGPAPRWPLETELKEG